MKDVVDLVVGSILLGLIMCFVVLVGTTAILVGFRIAHWIVGV